mmetsp:Transcript_30196/g.84359  ORF Transcript_30196/g.84359 Transcript_30196/m.84359 type:complete len:204 (-) Transcript_30196:877-1488(-)
MLSLEPEPSIPPGHSGSPSSETYSSVSDPEEQISNRTRRVIGPSPPGGLRRAGCARRFSWRRQYCTRMMRATTWSRRWISRSSGSSASRPPTNLSTFLMTAWRSAKERRALAQHVSMSDCTARRAYFELDLCSRLSWPPLVIRMFDHMWAIASMYLNCSSVLISRSTVRQVTVSSLTASWITDGFVRSMCLRIIPCSRDPAWR